MDVQAQAVRLRAGRRPRRPARRTASRWLAPKGAPGRGLLAGDGAGAEVGEPQQHESERLQREVQLDNPGVSLEETMVAMQKAQIGFQAALQVRNRLVQAYTDIMNMQV